MSEELPKVTAAQVARFLEAVKAVATCPSCAQNDWDMSPPTHPIQHFSLLGRQPNGSAYLAGQYVPLMAIVCGNCGFVRMHAIQIVLNWLKQHPEVSNG